MLAVHPKAITRRTRDNDPNNAHNRKNERIASDFIMPPFKPASIVSIWKCFTMLAGRIPEANPLCYHNCPMVSIGRMNV